MVLISPRETQNNPMPKIIAIVSRVDSPNIERTTPATDIAKAIVSHPLLAIKWQGFPLEGEKTPLVK